MNYISRKILELDLIIYKSFKVYISGRIFFGLFVCLFVCGSLTSGQLLKSCFRTEGQMASTIIMTTSFQLFVISRTF